MAESDIINSNIGEALFTNQYGDFYTPVEKNRITFTTKLQKLNSDLMNKGEKGYDSWSKLDSNIQDALKWFQGEEQPYMKAPETFFDTLKRTGWETFLNVNPVVNLFKVAGLYGKGLQTTYQAGLEATVNNKSILDRNVWSNAWDNGESIYNNETDRLLREKNGEIKSFIAKGILAGKSRAELISDWGSLDQEFIDQIYDLDENWDSWDTGILEDYRQAKLNIGREFANTFTGRRGIDSNKKLEGFLQKVPMGSILLNDNGTISEKNRDKYFTLVSGYTDTVSGILLDPLTYITGGASKGVTVFGMAATQQAKVNKLANAGIRLADMGKIEKIFSYSKVRKYWDEYGAAVKAYGTAKETKNTVAMNNIADDIAVKFPEHGSIQDIIFNLENEVFSANDAQKIYSQVENARKIIVGRVNDTTYFRDSVAVAKSQRVIYETARKAWYKFGSAKFADEAERAKFSKATAKDLSDYGSEDDLVAVATPTLDKALEMNRQHNDRVFNALSRNSGNQAIKFGDDAYETVDTFISILNTIMPNNVAKVVAQEFLLADTMTRLSMLRGTYRAVLESTGIDKTNEGKKFIEEVLSGKFGQGFESFSILKNPTLPSRFPQPSRAIIVNGPVMDKNLTETISNLPWEQLQKIAADITFKTGGKSQPSRMRILSTLGGATNSSLSTKFVDLWSIGTLFPKLGIRGAIDEAFMISLTAPMVVLKNVFAGRKAGQMVTAYTGSRAAVGPISSVTRRFLSKITGKKNFDPASLFDEEARREILENLRVQFPGKSEEFYVNRFYEVLQSDVINSFSMLSDVNRNFIAGLFRHNPNFLESATASSARRVGGNATIDDSFREIFTPYQNEAALRDLQLKSGRDFNLVYPSDFEDEKLFAVMYNAFTMGFVDGTFGGINLGRIFIKHSALRTKQDVQNAIDEAVAIVNTSKKNKADILGKRVATLALRRQGLSDDEIIREMVTTAFSDLYVRFHGSNSKFNSDLFDHINALYNSNTILAASPDAAFNSIIKNLNFKDYKDLVKDHPFETKFYTNVTKEGDSFNFSSEWKSLGDKLFEMMDRTNTALVRQPIVMSWYLHYREIYQNLEGKHYLNIYKQFVKDGMDKGAAEKLAAYQAEQFFTSAAMHDAISQTLKYVDNPHIRTNLAMSVKNVSRFYRATEDMWRRVMRLKSVSTRTIYRMRLLNSGLYGSGMIETDDNGKQYIVIPGDNAIFAAVDAALRFVSSDTIGVVTPEFARSTARITSFNPSFQDDAGIPYLSGPIAGVAVLGLKGIAGYIAPTNPLVEEIDNVLLGDIGDNIDFYKAVTPQLVQRVARLFDDQYQSTAVLQAIAYNQAYGKGLSPTASAEEVDAWLEEIRTSAHNVIVANTILGTVLPFSTSLQESEGLAEYLRDSGDTKISQEYYEILNVLIEKYGDELADPFSLAQAIFIGKNPGKLIYTVSREDKKIKPYIKKTEQVQDWLISNKKFVDKYGDAAYLFVPNSTKDELNLGVYNWMKSAGLVENIEVKEYLKQIRLVESKQQYFTIEDDLNASLDKTSDYYERKSLIDIATQKREQLKISNPLLAQYINDFGFNIEDEKTLYRSLQQIISLTDSPITAQQRRKVQETMLVFDKAYKFVSSEAMRDVPGFVMMKSATRQRALDDLQKMAVGDQFISQLINLVYKPILKHYSRSEPVSLPAENPTYFPLGQ